MKTNRIIIKVGTNLLTDANQRLDLNSMRNIVYQVSDAINQNKHVRFLMVSSGAITSGAKHINIFPNTIEQKQAAAAIGQILLFQKYYEFFQSKNLCVGQLLVTKDNFNNPEKNQNIQQTINTLLNENVIPILNENDSVSTEEIQFGDNDQLSATLAIHSKADKLILLTNADGVLDQDNRVIPRLNQIDEHALSLVQENLNSPYSKGGMRSKLLAAQMAMSHGIDVIIANGRRENIIHSIIANEFIGTTISKKSFFI